MVNIATIALLHKDNVLQGIIYVNEILNKTPDLELRFRTIMNSAKKDYLAPMIDVSCYDDIECCYTTSFLNVKDLNNTHSKKGAKKNINAWKLYLECLKSIDKGYNNIPRVDGLLSITQFPKSASFGKPAKLNILWNYDTDEEEGLKAFFNDAVSIVEEHMKDIICFLPSEPSDNQQLNPDESVEDVHRCIKCIDGHASHIAIPCRHLLFCTSCVKNQSICPECNQEIVEQKKIFIPIISGGNKNCSICNEKRRTRMAKKCMHLDLCKTCLEEWITTKTSVYEEDSMMVPEEEKFPCTNCNAESGGWDEIRFPRTH